jgi:predicted metal-dependent hydrolase
MDAALRRGIELFNAREYYECHEVLEDVWILEVGPRKRFLQSIIHLAVAYYHLGRGNRTGGVRQLRRAVRKLLPYLPAYDGVNTRELMCRAYATMQSVHQGRPVEYFLIGPCEPPR